LQVSGQPQGIEAVVQRDVLMRALESGKGRNGREPMNFTVIRHNASVGAADDSTAGGREAVRRRARRVRRSTTRNEISSARSRAGYISLVPGNADTLALL